jgi:hypothetical protein
MVEASVEARLHYAESSAEDSEYWRQSASVRQAVFVNRVEEQLKIYQMIPQTLAFLALSGVTVSEFDAIEPDDDDDDRARGDDAQDKYVPLFDEIQLITYEENYRIHGARMRGNSTEEENEQMEKFKYYYYALFKSDRSPEIEAAVFDSIWRDYKLRFKMDNVFFEGMDGLTECGSTALRYVRIDQEDRFRNGILCLSDMARARLKKIDEIKRLLVGEELGPTNQRAFLLTEDVHIDEERLKRAVELVHDNKVTIFNTFQLPDKSSGGDLKFGDKLKTLNCVLKAWGFAKIKPKRKTTKKVRHHEYSVVCNVPGFELRELYSIVRGNKFGLIEAVGAEPIANKPWPLIGHPLLSGNKRPRN